MKFRALTAGLALGFAVVPLAADAGALTPHRIVYDLSIAPEPGAGGAGAASGRMMMEFVGGPCEGYATRTRQVLTIAGDGRPERTIDTHSATFEEPRGGGMRFRSETRANGATLEKVVGQAERVEDGDTVIALEQPARERRPAGAAVLFPSQHVARIIAAAEAREPLLPTRLFDGGGNGTAVYDTLAVIGAALPKGVGDEGPTAPLADLARWPVRLSYFQPGPGEPEPFFTLDMTLYENGVAGAVRLDYPEFSLVGRVTALELLEPEACDL